jgi:two-component system catabolic regulation response regulator CreB/two-component system response regulator ChvI
VDSNKNQVDTIRILIVDDEEDIRMVLSKGLTNEGFIVQAEGDPVKALKDYRKGGFDLLLLDIRMPEMNGFELYREIRKLDPQVRVCFITAFEIYFDEFKRVFPKINVSCFIRKPVTIAQLARAVREELARPTVQEDEQAASPPKRTAKL